MPRPSLLDMATPAPIITGGTITLSNDDEDLTAIGALDSLTSGMIATDGAGWVKKTYAQIKTSLALVKADVGLANVDNTSDVNKPVSTAQAAADALKMTRASNLSDLTDVAAARDNLGVTKISKGTVYPSSPAVGDLFVNIT